jgi:hypothetical protein
MVFHLLLEAWQGWFVVFAQKNIKVKARRNHDFSAAVACSFYLMTGKNQMKLTARLVFERMCWFSAMCVVQGKVARGMVFFELYSRTRCERVWSFTATCSLSLTEK